MLAPREGERVDDAVEAERRVTRARELGVEEADVEARIMDDEGCVSHEAQKRFHMLGEAGLIGEEEVGKAMYLFGFRRHGALWIDVNVKTAVRRKAIEELDA